MTARRRGRPKKGWDKEWCDARRTALDVLILSQKKGWEKITAAVHEIASRRGISQRTVWSRWSRGDARMWAELELEDKQYDAMLDAAHEAAREAATDSLVEEFGEREFSDEEIYDRIEQIAEEEWSNFDP